MPLKILALMGSGETSPTMVKMHREIFAMLGDNADAILLDTPYGFQANADDISQKAIDYFRQSVGIRISLASMRDYENASSLELEKYANDLRNASYIFAGPGSPTYALSQWRATEITPLLADKLMNGGVLAFSSAAVLTLGMYAIPVYEIYKSGHRPELVPGLNVLDSIGIQALVIPHFNNAEGQNHDTRFCYMGIARLTHLRSQMKPESAIIGIDEHTGIIIDLENNRVKVVGLGVVTILSQNREEFLRNGVELSFQEFTSLVHPRTTSLATSSEFATVSFNSKTSSFGSDSTSPTTPLVEQIELYERKFELHLGNSDAAGTLTLILDFEDLLDNWRADTGQLDSVEKGRSQLRSMISRLEPTLRNGVISVKTTISPLVETLLELRSNARGEKRWGDADLIRDRLDNLGVLVQDTPDGLMWFLKDREYDS